jgi:hypothetical protein
MTRMAQRVHIPNLDPKFVTGKRFLVQRNLAKYWSGFLPETFKLST